VAANSYHAIVIGGGHNGLVAAAYLAKAGANVVVCEARYKTGGAAATDTPWPQHPDFNVTTLSYVMSLMPDTILRDLRMREHGYRVHPVGPYVVPLPNGRVLIEYGDPKATTRSSPRSRRPTRTRSNGGTRGSVGSRRCSGPC